MRMWSSVSSVSDYFCTFAFVILKPNIMKDIQLIQDWMDEIGKLFNLEMLPKYNHIIAIM